MRIIIPGASGFLGRNLVLALPPEWDAVALYRSSPDFPEFLRESSAARVKAVRADLLRPETFPDALAGLPAEFDAAVYLAANGDPSLSVKQPLMDLQCNTCALINFLERFRVRRLVFFSSGAVYDGLKGPVAPGVAVSPTLPYAISKWASENYIRFFAEQRGTIGRFVIFRFFGAYGPHEPERKIYTRLARTFGIERRRGFTVRGDGENLIDAMYVDDAVRAILSAVTAEAGNATVDLCTGTPLTINELVRKAARIFGVGEPDISHEGTVPEHIEFRASPEAMRELFGFRPTTPLAEGLKRLRDFIARREGQAP